MLVNEIFSSIEGEGIRAGYPATFIRLFGCNLSCSYCDSRYACEGTDYKKIFIDDIVDEVVSIGNKRVTLTGGEPLLHKGVDNLIRELEYEGFEVNVETNGSIPINSFIHYDNSRGSTFFTVDYKSISSGENNKMDLSIFEVLRSQDVLKFVVGSQEDLEDMKRVLDTYRPECHIFVSPIFGKIEPAEIVEFILSRGLQNCRMQLQIHKFIWDPEKRGV